MHRRAPPGSGILRALDGLDHVQTFFRSDLTLPHVRRFLAAH
jgi:hypothetical protein